MTKQEIIDNDYDLSVNKYRETEFETIEYPPASEIIEQLYELENEITEGIKALDEMLKTPIE